MISQVIRHNKHGKRFLARSSQNQHYTPLLSVVGCGEKKERALDLNTQTLERDLETRHGNLKSYEQGGKRNGLV